MPKEEFYAILKLSSGEEVISKVCAFVENEEPLLILDNPISVEVIPVPGSRLPYVKVTPWLKMSKESTHIIKTKDIITMNEIKDEFLIKMHHQYIKEQNSKDKEFQITPEMGFVNTTQNARKSLENLYKTQEASSNFE